MTHLCPVSRTLPYPPPSNLPPCLPPNLSSYLPSHLAAHCWSSDMAQSCSCYNPPTASAVANTKISPMAPNGKKGKGCFAFLLKMKPWQQPGIICCFQLFPWLLHFHGFLTCVNMPLYLQKRSPVTRLYASFLQDFSPSISPLFWLSGLTVNYHCNKLFSISDLKCRVLSLQQCMQPRVAKKWLIGRQAFILGMMVGRRACVRKYKDCSFISYICTLIIGIFKKHIMKQHIDK